MNASLRVFSNIYTYLCLLSILGPQTLNLPWQFRQTSVGKSFEGALTKIHEPDEDGNGEVVQLFFNLDVCLNLLRIAMFNVMCVYALFVRNRSAIF